MKSTQLKYLFLFCRQDVSIDSPSNHFIVLLQIVCPTWYISQHSFISNNLVVLADDTFFKGTFIAMCEVLHLNYDSKRNYKGLTVENYFRFLNKSVTIAAEERGTNKFLFLLVSQPLTLRIAHRLMVLIFFAVFQLLVRNFTLPSISVSMLCQN